MNVMIEQFTGWRAIAAHLKLSIMSVKRLYKTKGLPVTHINGRLVMANSIDLCEWQKKQKGDGKH